MSDDTSGRRPTRRNRSTLPVERGLTRSPTAGQSIRYTPISPDELADIITQARAQRTEEDIQHYARRKAA